MSLRLSRRALVLAFVVSLFAASARGEESFRKIPWHLVDVWWTLDGEREVEQYTIDVVVETDPGNEVSLYIAPTGQIRLNGIALYGGLVTHTTLVPGRPLAGRGVLFSRWDERRMDHVRPAEGMHAVSRGSEGDFVSVRGLYAWTAGAYEIRVRKLPPAPGDGDASWVRYEICARADAKCVSPGDLKFPGRTLSLGTDINAFVEIYRKAVPVEKIPHTVITFGNMRVNGQPAPVKRIQAIYPKAVPDYARARLGPGHSVRVELGSKADRSETVFNRGGARVEQIFPRPANRPIAPGQRHGGSAEDPTATPAR